MKIRGDEISVVILIVKNILIGEQMWLQTYEFIPQYYMCI